jgi:hypothetical protein
MTDTANTQIPDHLDRVYPGWHQILTRLHADVMALDPEYSVFQVKEKFGRLRVYLNSRHPDVAALLIAAENQSGAVCEHCGEAGFVRQRPGRNWMQCLCDVCVEKEPEL